MKNIRVRIDPEGREVIFPHIKTVHQLLNRLGFHSDEVLVIRGEELLTIDRFLQKDDFVIIRQVTSRG